MVNKSPNTFWQCQHTLCKNCTFAAEIPEDKQARYDYFEYCPQRKKLDKQDYGIEAKW